MEDSVEKIVRSGLFSGLTEDEMRKVLSIMHEVTWGSGERIMTEGETGESIYIVHSGAIEVSKRLTLPQLSDESGQSEKTLVIMEATDPIVIGEVAMLTKDERSATITAVRDCAGLEICGSDLERLCESDTNLGFKIMRNLAQLLSSRLRQTNRDVVKLATALSIVLSQGL